MSFLKNSRFIGLRTWPWWLISLLLFFVLHFSYLSQRISQNLRLLPYYDDISVVLTYKNLQNWRLPYISPDPSSINFIPGFTYHFNWEYLTESLFRALLQWGTSVSYLSSIGITFCFAFLIYFLTRNKLILGLFFIAVSLPTISGFGLDYAFQDRYMFFVLVASAFVSLIAPKFIAKENIKPSELVILFFCCLSFHFQMLLFFAAFLFILLIRRINLFQKFYNKDVVSSLALIYFFMSLIADSSSLELVTFTSFMPSGKIVILLVFSYLFLMFSHNNSKVESFDGTVTFLALSIILVALIFDVINFLGFVLYKRYFIIEVVQIYIFIFLTVLRIFGVILSKYSFRYENAKFAISFLLVSQLLFVSGPNSRDEFTVKELETLDRSISPESILVSDETLYLKHYFPQNLSVRYISNPDVKKRSSDFYQTFFAWQDSSFTGKTVNIYGEESVAKLEQICFLADNYGLSSVVLVPPFSQDMKLLEGELGISSQVSSIRKFPTESICN